MLVRFRTQAFSDITMFGDVAVELLKLMGLSGTVPGALRPEDIPGALHRLREGLSRQPSAAPGAPENREDDDDEFIDQPVSLGKRAFPLIEALEAAAAEDVAVSWEAR